MAKTRKVTDAIQIFAVYKDKNGNIIEKEIISFKKDEESIDIANKIVDGFINFFNSIFASDKVERIGSYIRHYLWAKSYYPLVNSGAQRKGGG